MTHQRAALFFTLARCTEKGIHGPEDAHICFTLLNDIGISVKFKEVQ